MKLGIRLFNICIVVAVVKKSVVYFLVFEHGKESYNLSNYDAVIAKGFYLNSYM